MLQTRQQGRLLVLDDDAAVAGTIGFIAEDLGFRVSVQLTPAAFFDEVRRFQPTHIALDLLMPEMDGVEVLRELSNLHCAANIILTSGMGRQILDAALRVGRERGLRVVGALPKPFLADTLRELLADEAPGWNMRTGTFQQKDLVIDRNTLGSAVERGELRMLFQPKVTPELRLRGFEALLRWRSPSAGDIPPARFIPAAEQTGLIHALTDRAVELALDWLSRQPATVPFSLAINLSVRDIERVELADRLQEACAARSVDPGRVILELTETGAMHNPANALDVLTRLRIKGFQLAIDDFGTGYSSMSQLVRMPFSEIKIDRLFVSTALQASESRTVVRSIIDLAANMGLAAVAEGVETPATFEFLCDAGCDLMQGYLISAPLEPEEASLLLGRLGPDGELPDRPPGL